MKNLSMKKANGKWWSYGTLAVNKWNNEQASFKVESLRELLAEAEKQGKEWVSLSVFEKKPQQERAERENQATYEQDDFDQQIPF